MTNEDFVTKMKSAMNQQGRKWGWLSEQSGVAYHRVYFVRVGRTTNGKKYQGEFTQKERDAIKNTLGHEYFW